MYSDCTSQPLSIPYGFVRKFTARPLGLGGRGGLGLKETVSNCYKRIENGFDSISLSQNLIENFHRSTL
jgi:hypothetical protein